MLIINSHAFLLFMWLLFQRNLVYVGGFIYISNAPADFFHYCVLCL